MTSSIPPESRPWSGDVRFLGLEVRSTPDSRRHWARPAKTESVKRCRTPAVARWLRCFAWIGRCRTRLRGGNRGGSRLGGAAFSVYGDLTAADNFAAVARRWGLGGFV